MNKGTDVSAQSRMLRLHSIAAGIIIVIAWMNLAAQEAAGQVEWKDRYVTIAPEDQTNPSIARQAPAGFGYTIIVWEHRDSNQGETDIYAQKIDNVNGLAQWWPRDGVPVCTYSGDQKNPRAAYDSLGGVIVVWEDERNAVPGVYVLRLTLVDGAADAAWPTDGVFLGNPERRGERPRISGTSNGAFVAWTECLSTEEGNPVNRDIYMQYITTIGTPAPGWLQGGRTVHDETDPDQINAELSSDHIWRLDSLGIPRTGVVVAYQDNRNASSSSAVQVWNIYADNVDATGMRQYGDVDAGADPGENEEQINPRLVTTGEDETATFYHAFIVWQDARDSSSAGTYDLYGQRLDKNGTKLANPDGMVICAEQTDQLNPCMAIWEQPAITGSQNYRPYIAVAWEDMRTGYSGVYAALVDFSDSATTAFANPNGSSGDEISQQQDVDLTELDIDKIPVGSGASECDVTIVWKRPHINVSNADIHYQSVRIPQWDLNKQANGWPVTEAKGDQSHPQVSGNVFAYEDARRKPIGVGTYNDAQDDVNIYCETPGTCVGATEMAWRDMFTQWTPQSDVAHLRMIVDETDGSVFMAWDDVRCTLRSVYAQKFDKDGVPRWTNNGVRVSELNVEGEWPDIAVDRNGGAQLVYERGAPGSERIYYAHVLSSGAVDTLYRIGTGNNREFEPVCVENFEDTSVYRGLLVACLTDNGQTIGREQGWVSITDSSAHNMQTIPDTITMDHQDIRITRDRIGGCYVLTHGNDNGRTRIEVAWQKRISGSPPGFTTYRNARLVFDLFGGYDLEEDADAPIDSSANPAHHLTVVLSAGDIAMREIVLARYNPYTIAAYYPINGANQPISNPMLDATNPAITSNHVLYQSSQSYRSDGVIITWDEAYDNGGSSRHLVATCQALWYNDTTVGTPTEFNSGPFILDSAVVDTTHPDVSHVTNLGQYQAPAGLVVWEGNLEVCSPQPSPEILSSYVIYGTTQDDPPGMVWGTTTAPNYGRVGPGSGYWQQSHPIIRKSSQDGVVFWYDTRTSEKNIIGTTIYTNGGDIDWRKETQRVEAQTQPTPDEITLSSSYPHPLRLSCGASARINFTVQQDCHVTLRLYDVLGRCGAVLHDGAVTAGRHTVALTPGLHGVALVPGLYFCRMEADGQVVVRRMVVTW